MAEKGGAGSPVRKKDIKGNIILTEYEVFPGIYLQQRQAQTRRLKVEQEESKSIFEISHCRDGRIELGHEQDFYYLAPGDLSIVRRSWHSNNYYFGCYRSGQSTGESLNANGGHRYTAG